MMICSMTGIHRGRMLLAFLAGFVVLFLTDYVFHGILLMPIYNETPDLWRSTDSMQEHFPWMLAAQTGMAFVATFFYALMSKVHNLKTALSFGTLLGLLVGIGMFASYAYMPISLELALYWLVGVTIQFMLVFVPIGLIYKQG